MLIGCTVNDYQPRLIAQKEMSVRASAYNAKFYVGRSQVTSSLTGYYGLREPVACVPRAALHAKRAAQLYGGGIGLAVAAGLLSVVQFGLIAKDEGLSSRAFGVGVVALGAAVSSTSLRYRALGHAVDAMNYYNDAVGSLGHACQGSVVDERSKPQPLPSDQREPASAAQLPRP